MSTLQINKTKAKQQTQLLPSRNAASRPSLRGSLLGLLPSSQTFALATIAFVSLAGITYFLHPFSIDNSYAEGASLDMSVTLSPTISIWTTDTNNNASNQVNISTSPDETVSTGTIRTHVSTNNLTGYTLTIQSNSNDAKMKHENPSITKTINPLTGNGTSASSWASDSSLNNMWGYSTGTNDSFVGVPSSSSSATTVNSSSTPSLDSYTDTTFGTKVDLNIPAGTYSDTVVFSATANYVQPATMQSFTSSDCTRLDTWSDSSDDITLRDTRDNNSYVVRKLADGNCWMTQNLRLSAESLTATGHSTTLDSSNTDIADTFTVPASAGWDSWDGTNAHVVRAEDAPIGSVDGPTADSDLAAKRGTYYNWAAAVATEGITNTTSTTYATSVCPKGWKLPTGDGTIVGTSTATTNQFTTLYAAYDNNKSNMDRALHYYNNSDSSATYAGLWDPGLAYLRYSGAGMNYWSGTTSTTAGNAWDLTENSRGGIYTAANDGRGFGFSVRCVLSAE